MFKLYKEKSMNGEVTKMSYFMKYKGEKYRVYFPTLIQKLRAKELNELKDQRYKLYFNSKKQAKKYIAEEMNEVCCQIENEIQREAYERDEEYVNKKTR